jgi:hypothetical protein
MTESARSLVGVSRSGSRGHGDAELLEILRHPVDGKSGRRRSLPGEQERKKAEENGWARALEWHGLPSITAPQKHESPGG